VAEFELEESVLGEKTRLMQRLFLQNTRATKTDPKIDKKLINLVLDHARSIISHPTKPTERHIDSLVHYPFAELALEESLEENPLLTNVDDFKVEMTREKDVSCVALLDCSYSMLGQKHLLASISVAVLLLELASRNAALVRFSSDASAVKKFNEIEAPELTVLNFLKIKPRGFTNMAKALELGLKLFSSAGRRRKVGLIATDG